MGVGRLGGGGSGRESSRSLRSFIHHPDIDLNEDALTSIAYFNPNLERLHMKECGQISNAVLDVYRTHLPNLKELSLCGCYLITDACMAAFLVAMPRLEFLGLEYSPKVSSLTLDQLPVSLKRLWLRSCLKLDGEGMERIAYRLSESLEELDVSDCPEVTDHAFERFFDEGRRVFPRLRTIRAKGLALGDGFLEAVMARREHASQLIELDLTSNVSAYTDVGVSGLAKLATNLRTLKLNQCSQLTDEGVRGFLAHGSPIRHLHWNGLKELSAELLASIAQHLHDSLETLDLSWCQSVDDDVLESLAAANTTATTTASVATTKLRTLSLWGCSGLTDVGVKLFARKRPDVELLGTLTM